MPTMLIMEIDFLACVKACFIWLLLIQGSLEYVCPTVLPLVLFHSSLKPAMVSSLCNIVMVTKPFWHYCAFMSFIWLVYAVRKEKSPRMCSVFTRWAVPCFMLAWWIYWGEVEWGYYYYYPWASVEYHHMLSDFGAFSGLGLHKWEAQEGSPVPGWCELFHILKSDCVLNLFIHWLSFCTKTTLIRNPPCHSKKKKKILVFSTAMGSTNRSMTFLNYVGSCELWWSDLFLPVL